MNLFKKMNSFFEISEFIIYLFVGLSLLIVSGFLAVYLVNLFINFPHAEDFTRWVVEIVDRLLLMLMIIEILYTVRMSLIEHQLCSDPFFIVALIAAIRRFLIISVESAYMPEKFNHHMIEMGILGGLILIFVVSLILLRWQKERHHINNSKE